MNDSEKTGAYQPARADPPAVEESAPALPPHVGRYRVVRLLGQGGFGLVYLAHDDQLQRPVAVKVPHARLVTRAADAEAYLTEARTVAGLDHPHIVPVYDVGRTDRCPCFVVSKYIDGTDLAARIRQSRLPQPDAVELVATVAETLGHAHRQGLVHRDVKPGNILLDRGGKPFVADFGMALREQDVGKGPRYAGTPAYMSPEQVRGEGHRVDGRSDLFGLGVVLYELLAGRRPFHADALAELIDLVATHEPRPLRQCDAGIPKELERICFKALAKRASERYLTAQDMADDLRHFQRAGGGGRDAAAGRAPGDGAGGPGSARPPTPLPAAPATPSYPSAHHTPPAAPRIVPKGLRSFDAHDADFFLELLPGPRDRDGLPDGVRFWKARVEETDPAGTFAVGLLCGPSGGGKSSLVKAGLLPRLSDAVIAVYVEATAAETEARVLNGLRRRCPELPAGLGVREALAAVRRGQGVPVGKKVLIVLDQFEQWLHARKDGPDADLVQALRQCDGGRVQCLVMVRDDFWMAVIRFMRELEVRLLEGHNSAAVDLFDADHARKVLAAYGRAFGRLPDAGGPDREQSEFLTQAVAGLAHEGKVVSVRLALFAEMMKGKPWTPAALKAVGGPEGVGVTFLEETFGSAAPPAYRYHQRAARASLKLLLPAAGGDIRGCLRSDAELREASGYVHRPNDFDDLVRILDTEVRLITPTDPDGKDADGDTVPQAEPGRRYYQLTHDYLVHAIREWLARKQKETRRGRAELLLAERAAGWNARPEGRQMPSLLSWLGVRWLTAERGWTPAERKMMRAAGRYHAARGAGLLACLVVLALVGWEGNGRLQARTLRDRLLEATTAEAPAVVRDVAPYRRWVDPLLREAYLRAEGQKDARKQLHASLALLAADAGQVDYLYDRLLGADPQEMAVIREALAGHAGALAGRLWAVLANPRTDPARRLRAACALATFAPDDGRWRDVSGDVAALLVVQNPFSIAQWTDSLRPAGRWLLPPLADFLVDEGRGVPERGRIASVYGAYAADVAEAFPRLEGALAEAGGPGATADARLALARKQASLGVALVVMGKGERVWPLLRHGPDPTVRSVLIERLAPGGVDPKVLLARLAEEGDVSARRAVVLCLGEYGLDRVSLAERRNHSPRLAAVYRDDPDPGVHAAAEWVLRQWGAADQVKAADAALATGAVAGDRRWYLTRQGQTMVVVPKPGEFWMGAGDERHRRRIDRRFAVASKEVTVDQFLRFRPHPSYRYNSWFAPAGDCPAIEVQWYDAAAYCNWLSEREGLPKDQWCYRPNAAGRYAAGMTTAPDYLTRTGYRLPTEAEWEFACRAGADTEYSFGGPVELLGRYGWFDGTSVGKSRPVGSQRPNDLGLFDAHGNVWEWCQDIFRPHPKAADNRLIVDREDDQPAADTVGRVLRGGSYNNQPELSRTARRNNFAPATVDNAVGFRPARTIRPDR